MHYFRGKFIQIKREMLHFSTKITTILTFIKKIPPKCIIIYHLFINFAT